MIRAMIIIMFKFLIGRLEKVLTAILRSTLFHSMFNLVMKSYAFSFIWRSFEILYITTGFVHLVSLSSTDWLSRWRWIVLPARKDFRRKLILKGINCNSTATKDKVGIRNDTVKIDLSFILFRELSITNGKWGFLMFWHSLIKVFRIKNAAFECPKLDKVKILIILVVPLPLDTYKMFTSIVHLFAEVSTISLFSSCLVSSFNYYLLWILHSLPYITRLG